MLKATSANLDRRLADRFAPISERIGKANLASVTYRKGNDFGKGVRSRVEIMIFLSDTVFLTVPISVRTGLNPALLDARFLSSHTSSFLQLL